MSSLSDTLRATIRARGWTQAGVARSLHVSDRTMSRWCAGETKPSYSDLLAVAALLRVDAADLVAAQVRDEAL